LVRFNDKRNLEYVFEIDKVSTQTANKPRYALKWNENKIQVVIFKEIIKEVSQIIINLISDINLTELNRQIANHEYGHILSAETTYDLYPDEARKYDVFKLTQEQLLPMLHSPLEKVLKQVSIERMIGTFWEFLANYLVKEKINPNMPLESLLSKEANLINLIQEIERKGKFTLYSPKRNESINDKGFERFFIIFRVSDEFYLYNKWKKFCSFFKGKGMNSSLKLMKIINKIFENIIRINSNIKEMKEDVIILTKHLDHLDFINITEKNDFQMCL